MNSEMFKNDISILSFNAFSQSCSNKTRFRNYCMLKYGLKADYNFFRLTLPQASLCINVTDGDVKTLGMSWTVPNILL